MRHSIASVISFCSNEFRFLHFALDALKDFSSEIYVVVFDHFFDGTLENEALLFYCFEKHPEVHFLFAPFVPHLIPKKFQKKMGKDFWFNTSRLVGRHYAQSDYILFLDADEIIDSSAFSAWLRTKEYQEYDAMRLENFWYFRSTDLQATTWEDSAVIARNSSWQIEALHSPGDRHALYDAAEKKKRHVLSLHGQPMIHHYSWVRTKEEIVKKMRSSAHKNENDWEKLIAEEWEKPHPARDFVHGYELKKVDPFISLDWDQKIPLGKKSSTLPFNVRKITPLEFLKIIQTPLWHRIASSWKHCV